MVPRIVVPMRAFTLTLARRLQLTDALLLALLVHVIFSIAPDLSMFSISTASMLVTLLALDVLAVFPLRLRSAIILIVRRLRMGGFTMPRFRVTRVTISGIVEALVAAAVRVATARVTPNAEAAAFNAAVGSIAATDAVLALRSSKLAAVVVIVVAVTILVYGRTASICGVCPLRNVILITRISICSVCMSPSPAGRRANVARLISVTSVNLIPSSSARWRPTLLSGTTRFHVDHRHGTFARNGATV
jgi:hypothetical protein